VKLLVQRLTKRSLTTGLDSDLTVRARATQRKNWTLAWQINVNNTAFRRTTGKLLITWFKTILSRASKAACLNTRII
jgi:hypothetical protein